MKRELFLILLFFIFIPVIFFYPIFRGFIPFPGDLLVGEYTPYNSYPFLGYSPGGYPNKGQDFDVLRLLYPAKEFSINMLKNFEFPLWNSYNFSGNPHLASLQSGSFYPFNLIFFLLPFMYGWTVFIMLQPILTMIFTFLFAKELRMNIKSSIFSSLIFSFSSYSVVWMEYGNIGHSIVWMPFALWMVLKNLKKPSILKSIAISLSLTFAILAGYIQTAFYVIIFVAAFVIFYILFIDRENRFRNLSIFFLIIISSLLLSGIQLLPMFELVLQSARIPYSQSEFLKLLIPPFHAITMFVPDFFGNPATRNYWLGGTYIERVTYIGVIPLIFILYSFFKKQNTTFWFFAISAITILLLTFDTYFARIVYSFQLPLISTAVPTRIMFLYCFSASIVAGFGFETFVNNSDKKIFLKVSGILGSVYLLLWVFAFIAAIILNFSWVQSLQISKRNLFIPSFIFLAGIAIMVFSGKLNFFKKYIIALLFVLTIFDLFYFFHKITPFAPKEAVYPSTEVFNYIKNIQGINRSWGYGSGSINANIQTHEKIFSTDGYDALHIKRYGELISVSEKGKIAMPLPRSEANLAPGFGESDLRNNSYRQQILNLLGVKYILHKTALNEKDFVPDYQTFPQDTYTLVWQKGNWQVYENKEVLPRAFLAADYVVETDKQKIIDTLFDKMFSLKETLILEESLTPALKLEKDEGATVSVKTYEPNKVVLSTSAKSNMLLFLSDSHFPGWKVSVDGEEKKIYRADYALRAVPIEKGEHVVIFWYYPESFSIGLRVSIVMGVIMLLCVLYSIYKGGRKAYAKT